MIGIDSMRHSGSFSELLERYRPPAGVWDEMKDASGSIRPHWAPFVSRLASSGIDLMKERRESAQKLLREHGVTYNVFADGKSDERGWNLDLLPMLIDSEEWSRLEAGLIQRTRLLNHVLSDIYGEQRMLQDGLAPPGLLHANPAFLRSCHGIRPAGGRFLSLHAVDLARSSTGEWWVLADRTQCPSGVGYALENRNILSRLFSDELRETGVQQMNAFFTKRKAGICSMAPWAESPTVVLLTPGPYTETYFEHSYLARSLGYPLVEGNDLAVRDNRVFVKTIEGLQPVDIVVRRVDDTFCDPLELRSDSFLGVPGLAEAARAGTVAISSILGSGAVEGPAWLAFCPALCRKLLGEELLIPNVATWWCGQTKEREYAIANLPTMVIKNAFAGPMGDPIFGEDHSKDALTQLAARIRARPWSFVAQQRVPLSTAPVWTGERLEPRPLIFRCFVAGVADGYVVLPGGLTRLSASTESPVVSSKFGGCSKDTWILSTRQEDDSARRELRESAPELHRGSGVAPSRALDNLYWLGRYTERLEETARLARVVLSRLTGEGGADEKSEQTVITRCLAVRGRLPDTFTGAVSRKDLIVAIGNLMLAGDQPGSASHLILRIGELTARLRPRFSGDTWRILQQIQVEFPPQFATHDPAAMLSTLHRLVILLAALTGVESENMTRGSSWRFLDLGRRIERAANGVSMLAAIVDVAPSGSFALVPLLEYSDSTMTYRRRYFSAPNLPTTLDLLLADASNPRSLAFQCTAIGEHLEHLPNSGPDMPEATCHSQIARDLESADFQALGADAQQGRTHRLSALLSDFTTAIYSLSDGLATHYFSHILPRAN